MNGQSWTNGDFHGPCLIFRLLNISFKVLKMFWLIIKQLTRWLLILFCYWRILCCLLTIWDATKCGPHIDLGCKTEGGEWTSVHHPLSRGERMETYCIKKLAQANSCRKHRTLHYNPCSNNLMKTFSRDLFLHDQDIKMLGNNSQTHFPSQTCALHRENFCPLIILWSYFWVTYDLC